VWLNFFLLILSPKLRIFDHSKSYHSHNTEALPANTSYATWNERRNGSSAVSDVNADLVSRTMYQLDSVKVFLNRGDVHG